MKIFHPTLTSDWTVFPGTTRSQAAEMVIAPGDAEGGPGNRHDGDQWLLVLSGTGEARIAGDVMAIGPRALLLIEAGEIHEIRNTGTDPLKTLNFYAPPQYRDDGSDLA